MYIFFGEIIWAFYFYINLKVSVKIKKCCDDILFHILGIILGE